VLAGSIVVLGLGVAIALPNGYVCRELDAVEVHRQWSFGQERWFYACFPSPGTIDAGSTFHPMDAATDWRIPLRIGVAIAGLALAWAVVVLLIRRGQLDATSHAEGEPGPTADRRTWILVTVYAIFGAAIAVLVTLRQDDYWVRGTTGPSFSTRSFFGWEMTPILAEALVAIAGAASGAAVGLLVAALHRRFGSSRAMADPRAGT
jgi:hypothetical protein